MKGRVLIVAGSDSGGGAGIQADIKTVTALGGYATTAITALTAQNTTGVYGIHDVPADFVAEQMRLALIDIGADCVKTGMLHRADVIEAVAATLREYAPNVPVVVDPVMVAKGGHALLAPEATLAMRHGIVPLAAIVTPNVPEAEALTGMTIRDENDAAHAARLIATLGPKAVLMTGGHLAGETVTDFFLHDDKIFEVFQSPRIETPHTHGTGCTLASAIAAGIAQGMALRNAVIRARRFVYKAIAQAPGLGRGHGPLDHGHSIPEFR
ncbi:MAG: bifunctional hydroxymethylpyrimidine kinase/phosphomethylpyrimidine kinase [Rhodospirillales bacterium RIFCSPLOWO2_12_FULL_67_15]|nr:MAG: bifunctional hydroxymethylpyrimidine kinase/phosphomethylpyrimidine kinase [Rhodospirillales bacterium RIFCSPLOWO2_12_FULL_67_15]